MRRSGRHPEQSSSPVRIGAASVDFEKGELVRDGQVSVLTALELKLLEYLLRHRGQNLGREELLEQVWRYAPQVSTRTVDVHISSLRQKIEPVPRRPRHLVTVHGIGYRLEV